MKVLSISHEFEDSRVDSVGFDHAMTMLEYDVVLFWPGSVGSSYDAAKSFQGRTSLSESGSFRLRDDVSRRQSEFRQFMKLGRTLVLMVPRPESWNIDTGEREYSGTGRN